MAAGAGTRFGGAKQHVEICGQTVLERSLATAAKVSNGVVVVVPALDVQAVSERLSADVAFVVVAGGTSRAASVRQGLAAVPAQAEIVCVHDAARPLALVEIYQQVIAEVASGAVGVVPVVPVTDTIRNVGGQMVDRANLLEVQTPQAFRSEVLRDAHLGVGEASDDASLVEVLGHRVVTVDGHRCNIKITYPEDLLAAEAWLKQGLVK